MKNLLINIKAVQTGSYRGYILENTPPPGEGEMMTFRGKNMKSRREKGRKCKRKRKKGERE